MYVNIFRFGGVLSHIDGSDSDSIEYKATHIIHIPHCSRILQTFIRSDLLPYNEPTSNFPLQYSVYNAFFISQDEHSGLAIEVFVFVNPSCVAHVNYYATDRLIYKRSN